MLRCFFLGWAHVTFNWQSWSVCDFLLFSKKHANFLIWLSSELLLYLTRKEFVALEIRLTQRAMIQAKISPLEFLVSQTWRLTDEKVTRYYLKDHTRETTRWNCIIFRYNIKTKFMLISPYRYIFPQISTTLCLKQVHPLWSPKGFVKSSLHNQQS